MKQKLNKVPSFAVAVTVGLLLALASSANEGDASAIRGQEIFGEHCASCHGETGDGSEPFYPSLKRLADLREPSEIVTTLITGRFRRADDIDGHKIPIMPAWGRLSDAEMAAVVNFITDFKAKQVDAAGLKELLIEDAQADLEDAIKASGYANVDYRVVWHMNQWQGVLAAADDVKADLIVKQSDAEHVRQFSFYTPDDWNLLRHALVPVLLMRPRPWPWPTKPIVIAAIDTYDFEHTALNHSILQTAQDACTRLQANLQIASVFPPLTIWLDRFQVAENYVGIRADIEDEIFNDIARLANEQHITRYRPRALEGMAAPTLAALATSEGASLLVMGTNARSGVEGFIIGNTAEKILNAMPCDVLTIPPPRANTATQEA